MQIQCKEAISHINHMFSSMHPKDVIECLNHAFNVLNKQDYKIFLDKTEDSYITEIRYFEDLDCMYTEYKQDDDQFEKYLEWKNNGGI